MADFYFRDEEGGEFQRHPTQGAAMAAAIATVAEYRRDAHADGEWSCSVEGVSIGTVDADGGLTPTHRPVASGSPEEGFDYAMAPAVGAERIAAEDA